MNINSSPWGKPQSIENVVNNHVYLVSTARHGGYRLSPEYNAKIPTAFRNSSCWYEEDCEAFIVEYFLNEEINASPNFSNIWTCPSLDKEKRKEGLLNWFQSEAESFFSQKAVQS